MDEGGGAEGVIDAFAAESPMRHAPELLIQLRNKGVERRAIAFGDLGQCPRGSFALGPDVSTR